MPNEELVQRGYLSSGSLRGEKYGSFERLNLGSTTVLELKRVGLIRSIPESVDFPFAQYHPPARPANAKPDMVFVRRTGGELLLAVAGEVKSEVEFNTEQKRLTAKEQALFEGAAVGAPIAFASDGTSAAFIDVRRSLEEKVLVEIRLRSDLSAGSLEHVCLGERQGLKDPSALAEKTWQAIWHATKAEAKQCLLTFVELFILKFLSDNLSTRYLPQSYSFYELTAYDSDGFLRKYGKTQVEYYVQDIRQRIKVIFPDRTPVHSEEVLSLFGLSSIFSTTSVINGFAFLSSGETSVASFNRTFLEILGYFEEFGVLSEIDPEFKLRLYEIFLKKSGGKQKLGQFFTPRNIVKAMIAMAELSRLPEGSIVMDPAAGVGGFVLEPLIDPNGVLGNISFESGAARQRVRFVGADVDDTTHILAKANTLIHLAEYVRDPVVTMTALNNLMADMFVLIKFNQHLGVLEYPVRDAVDIVLTNPPYVTQGSKIFKDEIGEISLARNGVNLKAYYDRCGLGLESLFLRYVAGALKPGGRAFVIVPQGMLTRTETSLKEKILSECNLLGSIALPRNAFFNTAQKTYILVLAKRHTSADHRPDVFCAIASSIGESLDARRVPSPNDNNLQEIATAFVGFRAGVSIGDSPVRSRIRVVPADQFTASDRWDVRRFWTDEELVELGAQDPAIERNPFIEEVENQLEQITEELGAVKEELAALSEGPVRRVQISDAELFRLRRGKRVRRVDAESNPGNLPVYSGSKYINRPLGMVSEEWARERGIPVETRPIVTVNANGYVGATFVRREKCIIHDDVMIIDVLREGIDLDYLAVALRGAVADGNFEYEAKLYSRVGQLEVEVPVCGDEFDTKRQAAIASAVKRFDSLREKLSELGRWSEEARIK